MSDVILLSIFVVAFGLWIHTGRDPLWLLIHGLIWLRAGVAVAYLELLAAWERSRVALPLTARAMRRELSDLE